ncbi:MAG: helix-turn-helix domain-containing protein [Candidatus Magasanikbacteria bacterium]|nr:helix-turn-helix domain-containing protein [Candidatus Magasanikbacteria bacterium]
MANVPKEFLQKRISTKKKLVNQNNKSRSISHSKKQSGSGPQKEQNAGSSDSDDGDGPTGFEDNFQDHIERDKMIPMPNVGHEDLTLRKSPLTIKPPLEIDLSSKQLLTVADLASMLDISRPTIYRLVEDRKIPFLKLGSLIRFTKTNIEQFLNERQVNPIY